MTPEAEGSADGPDVALTEAEREALDAADEQHDYPTETDDGLVMRCGCGATPPGHLLGQQVDEGLWLWRHRRGERMAAVERILADRLAAVTEQRDQYAALRDLSERATPGNWRQEFYRDGEILPDGTGGMDDYETPGRGVFVIDESSHEGYCLTEFDAARADDAAFIVAAVNHVRAALRADGGGGE
jgi:hypothetical protein